MGLFHPLVNGLFLGVITHLLTINPNFQRPGHPSTMAKKQPAISTRLGNLYKKTSNCGLGSAGIFCCNGWIHETWKLRTPSLGPRFSHLEKPTDDSQNIKRSKKTDELPKLCRHNVIRKMDKLATFLKGHGKMVLDCEMPNGKKHQTYSTSWWNPMESKKTSTRKTNPSPKIVKKHVKPHAHVFANLINLIKK